MKKLTATRVKVTHVISEANGQLQCGACGPLSTTAEVHGDGLIRVDHAHMCSSAGEVVAVYAQL